LEPVVFISRFRIKPGASDRLRAMMRDSTPQLEAAKPRTALFLAYVDEASEQVSFLHAFADARAMDLHFEGSEARARTAYEVIEPLGWEVYGTPSPEALETLRQAADSAGVSLTVYPEYVAGFLRLVDG